MEQQMQSMIEGSLYEQEMQYEYEHKEKLKKKRTILNKKIKKLWKTKTME
jgi:hypothetical protein